MASQYHETDSKPWISITCSAPINMAVVKYWGKRDESLILPCNSSLSATLHQDNLKTVTSAIAGDFDEDRIWLNGREEPINTVRLQNCLRDLRAKITEDIVFEDKSKTITKEQLKNFKVHIRSVNNFPTASGLASSASGFACLANLFRIKCTIEELSKIARVGSGSACRSLQGGFVEWQAGKLNSGEDSFAVQFIDEKHWPLNVFILVVNKEKKEISSTSGMETTVQTSELLKHRAAHVAPKRIDDFKEAIKNRDFQAFGKLTMMDSNQFHAVCLDTYPPIFYLNETSKRIIHLITLYNAYYKEIRAAYTFDAGPNACIFCTPENAQDLQRFIAHYFPSKENHNSAGLPEGLANFTTPVELDTVGLIKTSVGPGPIIMTEAESLFDSSSVKSYFK